MRTGLVLISAVPLLAGAAFLLQARPSSAALPTPAAQLSIPSSASREVAVFAGGCFWGVEGVFEHVKGVADAASGYAGGTASSAKYDLVSSGRTRHAEAVRVIYDPRVVGYADLLRIYFSVVADPTTLNRQGPDHGTQYRTALFPTSPAQGRMARAYIAQLTAAKSFKRPIVTSIEGVGKFYPAEAYHQDYMAKHPNQPYIVINDRPKVQALRRLFPSFYRA